MPTNPTSAARLADFGSGIGTAGATIAVDTATDSFIVGSGSTSVTLYGSTGIVSAVSYYGDGSALTGIDATSLKDSGGNIKVQATTSGAVITGVVTVTGNLQVDGTQTVINTTHLDVVDKTIGIASLSNPTDVTANGAGIVVYGNTEKTFLYDNTKQSWDSNIPIATDEIRFYSVAEKLTRIDGNTVTLAYTSNSSNIGFCTNPTGNITLDVVGIPTSSDFDSHLMSFSVIVNQTGVARSCTVVSLNGVPKTIKWAGGSLGNSTLGVTTSVGYDIYNFTAINTVGSAATTDNYVVFGVVNGGYV